jgi:hypothetical protein
VVHAERCLQQVRVQRRKEGRGRVRALPGAKVVTALAGEARAWALFRGDTPRATPASPAEQAALRDVARAFDVSAQTLSWEGAPIGHDLYARRLVLTLPWGRVPIARSPLQAKVVVAQWAAGRFHLLLEAATALFPDAVGGGVFPHERWTTPDDVEPEVAAWIKARGKADSTHTEHVTVLTRAPLIRGWWVPGATHDYLWMEARSARGCDVQLRRRPL